MADKTYIIFICSFLIVFIQSVQSWDMGLWKKSDKPHENVHSGESVQSLPNQNPPNMVSPATQVAHDEKLLDAEVFKSLLKDLLGRLDAYTVNGGRAFPSQQFPNQGSPNNEGSQTPGAVGGSDQGPRHINSLNTRHCALHGLWLSTVAGAAIELIPEKQQEHIEVRTKIFELPDNPYPPLITSQWTGKGIISPESPTTLTIVFQQHIEGPKENTIKSKGKAPRDALRGPGGRAGPLPRTAVFVGQCMVCFGSPMLQGTWVVFPAKQSCTGGGSPIVSGAPQTGLPQMNGHNSRDAMYLLMRYR